MYVVDAPTVSSNCRSDCHITFEICLIECSSMNELSKFPLVGHLFTGVFILL